MVNKLKRKLTIASLVITLAATQQSDARNLSDCTTLEKAQLATSILRAPCGIARNFTSKTHTSGKITKLLVNAVRLSDNILAMINAEENQTIYRSGWALFEAFNIGSSLVELTHDMPELEIDAQTERSIMNYLNQAQKVLLPCAESAAAVMATYYNNNGNETPQNQLNIYRYQSLISLSRTLSEFLESEKGSNNAKFWTAILVANTLSSLYFWSTERLGLVQSRRPLTQVFPTQAAAGAPGTTQQLFVQHHVQAALNTTNNIIYDANGIQLHNNVIADPGECTICLEEFRTQNNPETGADVDQSHIVATCNNRHLMHTECFAGLVYHAQNSYSTTTNCPQCRQDMNNPHYYRLVHQ